MLSWAFLFVGERCFEGTRAFSTQGIDKPILNLFRMYARMGRQEVHLASTGARDPPSYADAWGTGEPPDISGFATLSGSESLEVLVYCHHDEWQVDGEQDVDLEVVGLPDTAKSLTLRHYRLDDGHSNAHTEWIRQGGPMYPDPDQRAAIAAREGLELLGPPRSLTLGGGRGVASFRMPVHAMSLLILDFS